MVEEGKPKAVIVGGSIAGVSASHALNAAGWNVVVVEKTTAATTGVATGAGLSIDSVTQRIIGSWISQPDLLRRITLPLTIDQNEVIDSEKKVKQTLTRDESMNFTVAHWGELHGLLYNALPPNICILRGHLFLSFHIANDKASVTVKAKVLETDEIIEITGDLLVAADGCLSSIRQNFLPRFKLRYSGYWAWRGVIDFSNDENSETIIAIRKVYPELGKCLYFDLGLCTHSVLFELPYKRLNWIWYVNQPEPQLQSTSMTMKVSREMIQKMLQEAENVWIPELVNVMKETKDPFLNFIYDCDPLEKIYWDNVVLVGDAAHPTTPHCPRSTNMSVLDAAVLGKCMQKWGFKNLQSALEEYQSIRVPVTCKQVLHARRLGRIKQGLALHDREPFNPMSPISQDYQELLQTNVPFLNHVPLILNSI